jgi:transcriptional regulator with XRE-family HTH domain
MAARRGPCYAPREMNAVGELLKHWRATRRMSQLELGLEAGVSARHISFLETGRSRPSPEMLVALSSVLDVPLRERNTLLHAAGYAPLYRETSLDDPQMGQVRQALELILKQHEPFGAVAFDRRWDLVMASPAYARLCQALLGSGPPPLTVLPPPRPNLLRLLLDPQGLRPHIVNWEAAARAVLARASREMAWEQDPAARELLQSLHTYPDVPTRWRELDLESPQALIIPVEVRLGEQTLRLFTTITTLGSPQDITLQELRIESFHPVDEATDRLARSLAEMAPG